MAKKIEKFYVQKAGYYYYESELLDDNILIAHTQCESVINKDKMQLEYKYFIEDKYHNIKKILGKVPTYKKG